MLGYLLIVEDDKMIQKLLARMVKKAGYSGHIEVCEQAEVALDFVNQVEGNLDLVLIDTGLHPHGDAAFFHAIKSIASQIPIVASSGYSEELLRSEKHFYRCELTAILSKPFGLKDIKNLLQTLSLIKHKD